MHPNRVFICLISEDLKGKQMRIEDSLQKALSSHDLKQIDQAFERIYLEYSNLLFFVSKEYVSPCDAEDIVQETFIDFFNHLDTIDDLNNIKSYLVSSLRNKCINFLKTKPVLLEKDEDVPSISESSPLIVDKWQEGLNDIESFVIIEHVIVGKKLSIIAKEKKMSPNTLKSIYRRALEKARKNLKDTNDENKKRI